MAWWWPFGQTKQRLRAENAENAEKRSRFISLSFLRGLCGLRVKPSFSPTPTKALGNRGEDLACRFLKKAGLKILARNYRCPTGEIDIIALDPATRKTDAHTETIVFVEVKTRSTAAKASPATAVDARKRNQIRKAARYYLRHYPAAGLLTRYDIVAVVIEPNRHQKPDIRHIKHAF